jgi:hypothetical protein
MRQIFVTRVFRLKPITPVTKVDLRSTSSVRIPTYFDILL